MANNPAKMRQIARQMAIQALYEWQLAENDIPEIIAQALSFQKKAVDKDYFRELVYQVTEDTPKLEQAIEPYLDRVFDEVDPIEKAVLWIATFELLERLDVPYRVVINEALENAKKYGASQSHKFINGVLDKLAQKVREIEINAK